MFLTFETIVGLGFGKNAHLFAHSATVEFVWLALIGFDMNPVPGGKFEQPVILMIFRKAKTALDREIVGSALFGRRTEIGEIVCAYMGVIEL